MLSRHHLRRGLQHIHPDRNESGRFEAPQPRDLVVLRQDYEAVDLTLPEVAAKHGISVTTLRRIAVDGDWRMRQPRRVDRHDLIDRMFRLLDRNIRELENDMANTGSDKAAVLGRLVTALDRLIEIKDAEAKKHPAPKRASKAMTQLRAQIADRIAQFAQS